MVNPLAALFIAFVAASLTALLFWPVRGLYWRWEHVLRASDRVLSEDALKHLFDCEYRELTGTLHGLTGALGISDTRAAALLGRLHELELIESTAGEFRLTDEGRVQALQIIRVHRLWEHHLSEDTGMGAAAWHREADRLEHTTSAEEAEAMAIRLGHPRYDPHGDPIPTASGELRSVQGRPLSDIAAGAIVKVTHIEDEPDSIYQQLVAAKMHVGMQIRVLEVSPDKVCFEVDGRRCVLTPLAAANLSVAPVPDEEAIEVELELLSVLQPGERGEVAGISAASRGAERRRMMDLGIIPGTVVTAELQGPGGDPTGYRIRGAVIALRRQQADRIRIRRTADRSEREEVA